MCYFLMAKLIAVPSVGEILVTVIVVLVLIGSHGAASPMFSILKNWNWSRK